jgi:membrane-bound lytic murein transglycosylase B
MLARRTLLGALAALAATPAVAATRTASASAPVPPPVPDSFRRFVAGVRAEARQRGISAHTLTAAFAGVRPNQRVIELDRHQPEFTFTWDQYRSRIVSAARIAKGRGLLAAHRGLLARVSERYGVPAGIIMGIWGLESDYGAETGGFNVVEALATLSWEGRRAAFFRSELMDALTILEHGDIAPRQMVGSYAGAMGQTQFMPDSFLKYAVDFSGTGRRDIWNDLGCVFASTANYLAREGWQGRLPWGVPVRLPAGLDPALTGRDHRRAVAEWISLGVRRLDGAPPDHADVAAAVILPGGPQGEAFLAYHPNFLALRRYNPSDFYCLSVGLIGDAVTA